MVVFRFQHAVAMDQMSLQAGGGMMMPHPAMMGGGMMPMMAPLAPMAPPPPTYGFEHEIARDELAVNKDLREKQSHAF